VGCGIGIHDTGKGGRKKKSDVSEWVLFFAAAEIFRDFFYRVFELPLLRNAQKRDKKTRAKQPREGGNKTEGEKPHFLWSDQMDFRGGTCRVFGF
jgi:hypothetical protein